MADNAAACPACGELRYQQPAAAPTPQYGAPQQQYQQPGAQYPQQGYPQQQYGAPQGGQPQYAMPVSADEAKGFIGALFDLSFSSFITTKLIKVLYILAIIGAGLEALAVIGVGFARGSMFGLVMLIASPIVFFAIVILARVYMELVMVIFRAAELLAEIAKNTKKQ
ncbi:MAG TPA: DUF4282 domain-containing protein [Bryobacteraceae bacterium]|jgi:hypothetical protein